MQKNIDNDQLQGSQEHIQGSNINIETDIPFNCIQTKVVRVGIKQEINKSNSNNQNQISSSNNYEACIQTKSKSNQLTNQSVDIPNENVNIQLDGYEMNSQKMHKSQIDRDEHELNDQIQNNKEIQLVEVKEASQNKLQKGDIEQQLQGLNEKKNQEEEQICRICLDGQQQQNSSETELLNICECKGSLEYIHKSCLWLQLSSKVKLEEFERNSQQFKCELCKNPYRIRVGVKHAFQNLDKFKQSIKDQIKQIIIFLSLFLVNAILAILIISFIQQESQSQKQSAVGFLFYMFVSLVTTASFVSFLVLMHIFFKAGFTKKVVLLDIFKNKEDYQNFCQQKNNQQQIQQQKVEATK
ncbi:hypothetical protein ABPG74_019138 [Tetrahymena malaccensis]